MMIEMLKKLEELTGKRVCTTLFLSPSSGYTCCACACVACVERTLSHRLFGGCCVCVQTHEMFDLICGSLPEQ